MAPGSTKVINGYSFTNWGSHSNHYPCAYLTGAAAIGMTKDDVDTFLHRLDKCLSKCSGNVSEQSQMNSTNGEVLDTEKNPEG